MMKSIKIFLFVITIGLFILVGLSIYYKYNIPGSIFVVYTALASALVTLIGQEYLENTKLRKETKKDILIKYEQFVRYFHQHVILIDPPQDRGGVYAKIIALGAPIVMYGNDNLLRLYEDFLKFYTNSPPETVHKNGMAVLSEIRKACQSKTNIKDVY